jgi:uncharacterized protein YdaU (DUF1376 family)
LHYYSHHIGDFIKDTSRLSDSQTMTYLRLIWLYYESEKPLPLDAATLAFKTGSDESTVTMILSAFFKRSDNGWIQMRCESEIRQYQAKAESARNANRARWSDSSLKSDKKSDKESYPNQEPITNNHKPVKEKHTHSRFDARLFLSEQGVEEKLIADWTTLRRAKKLPLTETAINGVQREATKAGLLLADAITVCCERGWAGFKAEWLDELKLKENRNGQYADFVAELTGSKRKDRAENVIDGNAERLD